jgi:TetR/AcrR family transcriptional regulator, transcriptional repressor for nem operon
VGSRANKEQNHEKIIGVASKRFREAGLEGLSIADLMSEAGLTHGGFYKHFESRDDLVAQSLESALQDGVRSQPKAKSLRSIVEHYLSEPRCDEIGTSCAVSALMSDVGRAQDQVKSLYTQYLKCHFKTISLVVGESDPDAASSDAIVAFGAMVGALGLARAASDKQLSREILEAVRRFVLREFSPKSSRMSRR